MQSIAKECQQVWQWLVSGNNATAMATATAMLAFIGLWFYTVYTRRMMQIAQETRRAEIYPYFVIRGDSRVDLQLQHMQLDLVNIGGNAAKVEGWHQSISDQFQLGHYFFQGGPAIAKHFYGAIMKNEKVEINIVRNAAARTLTVLDIADTGQGKHQFKIIVDWREEARWTIEGNMVHPDVFLPFGKRWVSRLRAMIALKRKTSATR